MSKVYEFDGRKYVTTPLGVMSYKWFIENRNLLGFYYKKQSQDWVILTQKVKASVIGNQGKIEQADTNIPVRMYNMRIAIWKAQKKLDQTIKSEGNEIYNDTITDEALDIAKAFKYGDRYIPEESMCKNYSALCKDIGLKDL